MNIYGIYFKNEQGVQYEGHCELHYDSGFLVSVLVKMELNEKQRSWFFSNLPILENLIKVYKTPKMQVTQIKQKIAFTEFWDTYNYKVGKKHRAETLWKALNDEERTKCMLGIIKYKRWLFGRSVEVLYPETFLNQRRWENEF